MDDLHDPSSWDWAHGSFTTRQDETQDFCVAAELVFIDGAG
jgi:hypothetical protein